MVNAIFHSMTSILTIDRAGRIVLPKPIRDQMGLHPGSQLEVHANYDHLELRPVEARPSLVSEGSLLVHTGSAPGPLADSVRLMREERIERQSRAVRRK
jgi:AbrB family looped-hinge helix DNA binding protein